MHRFWNIIIEPVLTLLEPEIIVEIGSDQGKNTVSLLEFCKNTDAVLHAVDPVSNFDVDALKKEYGPRFVFHKSLSLNAIPRIKAADVFLIDGDHNWYTVFNELKLIEKYAADADRPFPVVMLHDIAWPYGRRDLYYYPENIPGKFRKPFKQKGIRPEVPDLLDEGGLNAHLNNSIYENALQNGVLTAIEDFLKEAGGSIEFFKLPGLCGLGILLDVRLKQNKNALFAFLDGFDFSTSVRKYFDLLEGVRIETELLQSEKITAIKKVNKKKTDEIIALGQEKADEIAVLQERYRHRKAEHAEKISDFQCKIELMVSAHKEEIDRLKSKLTGRDIDKKNLGRIGEKALNVGVALINSNRWRLGNAIGSVTDKVLFKPRAPGVADQLDRISCELEQCKKKTADNEQPVNHQKKKLTLLTARTDQDALSQDKSLSIIILNRDGANHLKTLFDSFLTFNTYPHVRFVVVDHGSSDGSLETLLSYRHKLDIDIILYDSNNSFSFSNNVAAKKATSDYLLFLNNDIIFSSDPIPRLVEYLGDPNIGIVGLKLLYPETHVISSSKRSRIFSKMKRFIGRDTLRKVNSADNVRGGIQHAGVRFVEDIPSAVYRGYNLGKIHGTDDDAQSKGIFPAVTAAAMLCRRKEFLDVGGFYEEYMYGVEDVDLCLSYMSHFNKVTFLADRLTLIHNESSTQDLCPKKEVSQRRKNNWNLLKKRYGYSIRRLFHRDFVAGDGFWSGAVVKAAFAVTEAHEDAKAGDYYTAMELACACEEELGWSVKFLARNEDWYDLTDVDVLVVMVDVYDLSEVRHAKPGLIRIAWMRNWFDRWAGRDSFNDYDIFLCSCRKGLDFISKEGKKSYIFPIATNEKRFSPKNDSKVENCDYCFSGHKWGITRDIEEMLNPAEVEYRFAVYGNNWDEHDKFGKYWKGFVRYGELSSIYANVRVVIDDVVNGITKPWGSMNSRVFDALASGALVITNNTAGAHELFGDQLPTYTTREELHTLLDTYLGDENRRNTLANALRKVVLEKHTYHKRAFRLRSILTDFYENKFRISIKVPVPRKIEAEQWGDYHFALGLKRALVKYGHAVRLDLMPEWETPLGFADDVVIVLRGLSSYTTKPDHINIMWNISHPDKISTQEYETYDHVFVASQSYVNELKKAVRTPVSALLQCTDTGLFYPDEGENIPEHDVLFVGNSRKQDRKIVRDAIAGDLPLSVYGTLWKGLISKRYIKGEYVKNQGLRCFYSRCKILLNDHWPSMGAKGFISNRIFDAGACGTCVVSDNASGMEALFGDAVTTCRDAGELKSIVSEFLSNDRKRKACGEKLREIVRWNHTFEKRAIEILGVVKEIDREKRSGLSCRESIYKPTRKQIPKMSD